MVMKEKYDVIIVGTGVAGCFAALHLSETMDVLMITKGDLEESDSFRPRAGSACKRTTAIMTAFMKILCVPGIMRTGRNQSIL